MKIVGVSASPRRGKNTALLVQNVLQGAKGAGSETEFFQLDDYQWVEGGNDKALHDALEEAQGLVLGTPIYLDHVSAQCKVFLDWLYTDLAANLKHRFPKGVKAVLVVTCGMRWIPGCMPT
ncbi:MAG: hypothetical protein A2Y73_08955 [Chloroflexi bacterium RBG_13_56_8]|nr:MAG: hypothetical protein A2Y73_08955 [Chloroflexi bacterium RBG_13_56_8]